MRYRYGFNGQEKTPEVSENSTTAEFWQYDARIGRRFNVDPVVKEYESVYLCFSGNPIFLSDFNGRDPKSTQPVKTLIVFLNSIKDPKSTPLKNILINFQGKDRNYEKKSFNENGWHVINAKSLNDANNQISKYLGKTKADNIYIKAHGGENKYFKTDNDGKPVKDEKGNIVWGDHSGIKIGPGENDYIFSNEVQDFTDEKRKVNLSSKTILNIETFINIVKFVGAGKNCIVGSCLTGKQRSFGSSVIKILDSKINFYINRDITSSPSTGNDDKITFDIWSTHNQTPVIYEQNGWDKFTKGVKVTNSKNLIMNKNGPVPIN